LSKDLTKLSKEEIVLGAIKCCLRRKLTEFRGKNDCVCIVWCNEGSLSTLTDRRIEKDRLKKDDKQIEGQE